MANEKRLIDITPLVDECEECMSIEWNHKVTVSWADAEEEFMQRLLDAPVVDAVEVVHGRWEEQKEWDFKARDYFLSGYTCSHCGVWYLNTQKYNYCPNCGAKMDGDGNG